MSRRSISSPLRSERGSALLVALCLGSVFALCLTSYISLCYTNLGISNRNLGSGHSIELAEAGMEQALWAVNNSYGTGWTVSGTSEVFTQNGFSYDNTGSTGQFTVTVANYASSSPSITSTGSVTLGDGTVISRTLTSSVGPTAVFVNALGADNGKLKFKSSGLVDSYTSTLGVYNATTNAGASAIVLSGAVNASSATVQLGTSTIKGYVVTQEGSKAPTISSATVTASKVIVAGNPNQPIFNESTPVPDPVTPLYLSSLTANTTIGYSTSALAAMTSAPTTPLVYTVTSSFTTNGYTLTVQGPVILKINGNFTVASGGQIVVSANKVAGAYVSSLEVHVRLSTSLGGNGINNLTLNPQRLALVNTLDQNDTDIFGDPSYETETISTTVPFYGVMYFPYDALTISSSETIYGSVVASSITLSGSPTIHYDMSLRSMNASAVLAASDAITQTYSVSNVTETQ